MSDVSVGVRKPCRICGRQFAKHEPICRKTAAKNPKVFDSAKQRAEGTEVSYKQIKESQKKIVKPPKSNWRLQHQDFINTVRAARDVSERRFPTPRSPPINLDMSRMSLRSQRGSPTPPPHPSLNQDLKERRYPTPPPPPINSGESDGSQTLKRGDTLPLPSPPINSGESEGSKTLKRGNTLPPPPSPSINPDYEQCPYCARRFNAKAAERHINFCKEQQSRIPNRATKGDPNAKAKMMARNTYQAPKQKAKASPGGAGDSPGYGRAPASQPGDWKIAYKNYFICKTMALS
ncbi:unnamed protein product [Mytilus coruscus]|uniref:C2HC/C3H-type domain-containing protein n=1 Tax=Mytilus coruscus TaxID=42192 RepID=A0A6J8CFU9_MYTCO|nr:unnamed protein product [Mytilus coruscus]